MMPYGIGMYIAYVYFVKDKKQKREFTGCGLIWEWLCFFGIIAISIIGKNYYNDFMGSFLYFWIVIHR